MIQLEKAQRLRMLVSWERLANLRDLWLSRLEMNSISQAFSRDNVVLGATSGARAYVDDVDSDTIWFHQTESTGFVAFTEGESLSEEDGSGTGLLEAIGVDGDSDAHVVGEMDPTTGEILYIDNRAAIARSADQTEDIKIIIQF